MPYENDPNYASKRKNIYILPLAILAFAVIVGLAFFIPDNDADNLASMAPAAGSMENSNGIQDNAQPLNR